MEIRRPDTMVAKEKLCRHPVNDINESDWNRNMLPINLKWQERCRPPARASITACMDRAQLVLQIANKDLRRTLLSARPF